MKKTTLVLLIPLALGVTGCAPLLIGGGAAAGYYAGKDERTLGEMTDDATVTARVKNQFINDAQVNAWDINVDTYRGVVSLYGSVPSQAAANRAVSLARGTEGVKQVNSRLTIATQK